MNFNPAELAAEEWRPVPGFPVYEVAQNPSRWRRKQAKSEGYTVERTSPNVPLRNGGKVRVVHLGVLVREVFAPPVPTLDERIAAIVDRLGRDPDVRIAADAGLTLRVVTKARRLRGIGKAPHLRMSNRKPGDSAVDAFAHALGKVCDSTIAKAVGVSRAAVQMQRARLGVPALGGVAKAALVRRELAEEIGGRLGRESDRALAAEFRVATETIAKLRAEACLPAARLGVGTGARSNRLNAFRHLLGKQTDASIARLAGVKPPNVVRYRKALGIPAFDWRAERRVAAK